MLKKVKNEIISVGKNLYKKGLIAGFDGNISTLLNDGNLLITASGSHKGFLSERQFILLDKHHNIVEGNGTPSSEAFMHLEIYKCCPKARAIVHTHAPFSTAAGLKAVDWIDISELMEGDLLFQGRIKVLPFLQPGSKELAQKAGEAATESRAFILKGHGAVTWGENLLEAMALSEAMEHNLKILALKKLF